MNQKYEYLLLKIELFFFFNPMYALIFCLDESAIFGIFQDAILENEDL